MLGQQTVDDGAVGTLYLNTYEPLVINARGTRASEAYGIPPFVDGSIRREPDLEHTRPSISCLCRGGAFAPRLREGDVVVYMTKKGRYRWRDDHWRVTAVLLVTHRFPNHNAAAAWYRAQGVPLPSNCMVKGNPPKPVEHSHGRNKHKSGGCGDDGCGGWDAKYHERARNHGWFLVCERLWGDVTWEAPRATPADLRAVFRRVPSTRNPGALGIKHLQPLLKRLAIPVPPRCP